MIQQLYRHLALQLKLPKNNREERSCSYRYENSNIAPVKIAKAISLQGFATVDFIKFEETETI